jgi:hypothetical protein
MSFVLFSSLPSDADCGELSNGTSHDAPANAIQRNALNISRSSYRPCAGKGWFA